MSEVIVNSSTTFTCGRFISNPHQEFWNISFNAQAAENLSESELVHLIRTTLDPAGVYVMYWTYFHYSPWWCKSEEYEIRCEYDINEFDRCAWVKGPNNTT